MLSQPELLISILNELERQYPGITLSENEINNIMRMADRIVMMVRERPTAPPRNDYDTIHDYAPTWETTRPDWSGA